MDPTGISIFEHDIDRLTMSLNFFGFAETERYQTTENKKIEVHIKKVIQIIHKNFKENFPFLALELEKHCINFESAFFATTE